METKTPNLHNTKIENEKIPPSKIAINIKGQNIPRPFTSKNGGCESVVGKTKYLLTFFLFPDCFEKNLRIRFIVLA